MLGVQVAKLSGYRVATTCSRPNLAYLQSLGADAGGQKPRYRALLSLRGEDVATVQNAGAEYGYTLAYTCVGEPIWKGRDLPAKPEDLAFAKTFGEMAREMLAQGKVKPVRMDVNRGSMGLEGVLVWLQELKQGKVSGTKLVYAL